MLAAKKNGGITPMHSAAAYGSHQVVEALIHQGGDKLVWDQTNKGDNACHVAAAKGHYVICEYLCRIAGAEIVAVQNKAGDTSLHVACSSGNRELAEMFMRRCKQENVRIREIVNEEGMTPLHAAASGGSVDCCDLMSDGASHELLFARTSSQDTCLHLAAFAGSVDAARFLLNAGGVDFALVRNQVGCWKSPNEAPMKHPQFEDKAMSLTLSPDTILPQCFTSCSVTDWRVAAGWIHVPSLRCFDGSCKCSKGTV